MKTYQFQMVFWRLTYFHFIGSSRILCFLSVQWKSMAPVVVLDPTDFNFMHKNILHVSVKWTCSRVGLSLWASCWYNIITPTKVFQNRTVYDGVQSSVIKSRYLHNQYTNKGPGMLKSKQSDVFIESQRHSVCTMTQQIHYL